VAVAARSTITTGCAGGLTTAFEEMVAYLAQITDKTRVARQMGISWPTVGAIVTRVVARHLQPERLASLRWTPPLARARAGLQ
jgi:hypothetical protein